MLGEGQRRGVEVEASRAIVALPPALAARIELDPPLPSGAWSWLAAFAPAG